MTRLDLLKILVGQARDNGFEFRRWYTSRLLLEWTSADDAFAYLEKHRRYYALLFAHEFARCFWKAGEPMTFQVPSQSFERRMADGTVRTVNRKPFMRRTARTDVWRYHLREMASVEEPLRYIRKFLPIEEDLRQHRRKATTEEAAAAGAAEWSGDPGAGRRVPATLALARRSHERREMLRAATAQAGGAKGVAPSGLGDTSRERAK